VTLFFVVVALGVYIAIAAIKARWSYGTAVTVVLCATLLLMFVVDVLGLYKLRNEPGEKPWLVWEGPAQDMRFRRYQEPSPYVARGWR
jgi:hypothetical protein